MAAEVILYDVSSRGRASCFSHDVWKIRLILNYKKIPYKTVWLEHKDIEPTLKSISPTDPQKTYTLPTLLLPSGLALSDPLLIAQWAEATYPIPSLYLPCTPHALAAQRAAAATLPLIPVLMPRIPRDIIRPESVECFEASSAERFGMLLEMVEKKKGSEQAWEKAKLGLDSLEELVSGPSLKVEGDGGGPFVLGSQVSYADFVVVAVLEGFRRVGEDLFERAVANRKGLRGVWERCGEWLERDD